MLEKQILDIPPQVLIALALGLWGVFLIGHTVFIWVVGLFFGVPLSGVAQGKPNPHQGFFARSLKDRMRIFVAAILLVLVSSAIVVMWLTETWPMWLLLPLNNTLYAPTLSMALYFLTIVLWTLVVYNVMKSDEARLVASSTFSQAGTGLLLGLHAWLNLKFDELAVSFFVATAVVMIVGFFRLFRMFQDSRR